MIEEITDNQLLYPIIERNDLKKDVYFFALLWFSQILAPLNRPKN